MVLARFIIIVGMSLFDIKAGASEVTLCQSHEEVYFNCQSDGRLLSVCASGNVSPDNGYVQYRFGVNKKIELEYPRKSYPPRKRFSISDIAEGNANFTHLKFNSGGFHYVLYQGDSSGIYVKRNGRVISSRRCDSGVYQPISPRAFRGIETVPPIDGIDN